MTTAQGTPPSIPAPRSSVFVRAVVWHPQRIIGLAMIEGLRAQGAVTAGFVAVDIDTALGAGLDADVLLVAVTEVDAEELRELIEALHHRRRDIPVLAVRSQITVEAVLDDLLQGARGTLCLTEDLIEAASSISAALNGLIVIPNVVQSGVIAALSDRARSRREANKVLATLTAREVAVLEFLIDGTKVQHIAAKLSVSTNTVRTYLQRLRLKLDVHSQLQLAAVGRELLAVGDGTTQSRPTGQLVS